MAEKGIKKPVKTAKAKAPAAKAKPKAAAKAVKPKAAKPKVTAKTPKKRAKFALKAPEASAVYVVGCFNEWNPESNPMRPGPDGVWTCTMLVDQGEHEYRFVVDGVWWDDPENYNRRPNDCGSENCIIYVE